MLKNFEIKQKKIASTIIPIRSERGRPLLRGVFIRAVLPGNNARKNDFPFMLFFLLFGVFLKEQILKTKILETSIVFKDFGYKTIFEKL